MKKQILLHIGSPKCGSTYFQRVMLQNQALLRDQGIHYPDGDAGHPGNAMIVPDISQEQFAKLFPDPNVHTTVLSHENLYAMPQWGKALSELAKQSGVTVRVLVFLRPFSEFLYGDYSQFMKQFFDTYLQTRKPYDDRTFESFAQRRIETLKPAGFLPKWAALFPEAPLVLESHRNIRQTFETLLGAVDGMDWTVPTALTNPSLRVSDCDDIAAAMRDLSVTPDAIKEMFQQAFHQTDLPDTGRTTARTEWLEVQFEAQNAILFEKFGFNNRLW